VVTNPERVSFYGEVGLGTRWFTDHNTATASLTSNAGDFTLGAGIWIPAGRFFRFVPKISVGLSSFGSGQNNGSGSSSNQLATFGMLSVTGFYNADL
jgi:hypothetical protein